MGFRVVILLVCLGLTQAKLYDLSCKQIRQFVDGHNSRRMQLARGQVPGHPAAAEMKAVIWDHELAAKAAKWASKNLFKHNPDKTVGSGRFRTGENLYWYKTTDATYKLKPDAALEAWFTEYKYYSYRPLADSDFSGSGKDIGHYTQMAWADSTHIGCAISQYASKGWNSFMVVCNYGPGGNYIGETPYRSGRASGKLVCGVADCRHLYGDKC